MDPLTSTDNLPQNRGSLLRLPHVVTEGREGGKYGLKTRASTISATCGQQTCSSIINTRITFGNKLVSLR